MQQLRELAIKGLRVTELNQFRYNKIVRTSEMVRFVAANL